EIMAKFPATEFYYAHGKNPRVFEDIENLGYCRIDEFCDNSKHFNFVGNQDTLDFYINTWIGLDPKYVLPGLGCTIRKNLEMYNDTFKAANVDLVLEREYVNYIPSIDFSKINKENIARTKEWMSTHLDMQNKSQLENTQKSNELYLYQDNFPEFGQKLKAQMPVR
ncbi:unnamed protein product, partial [marine sediment metagenome]